MHEHGNADPLNSSLTDLMTSLMVIFVLLFIAFVQRSAGRNPAVTDALLTTLRDQMIASGLDQQGVRVDNDKKDRNAISVIVPEGLMSFESAKFDLRPAGQRFLAQTMPKIASVLCDQKYRDSVAAIIVEGHSDRSQWEGYTAEESQSLNLKLSQDRSMAVVQGALSVLDDRPRFGGELSDRGCFLEKLSASGRGDQDPLATEEQSRRVIFKIRVGADRAQELEKKIK